MSPCAGPHPMSSKILRPRVHGASLAGDRHIHQRALLSVWPRSTVLISHSIALPALSSPAQHNVCYQQGAYRPGVWSGSLTLHAKCDHQKPKTTAPSLRKRSMPGGNLTSTERQRFAREHRSMRAAAEHPCLSSLY